MNQKAHFCKNLADYYGDLGLTICISYNGLFKEHKYLKKYNRETAIFPIEEGEITLFPLEIEKNKPQEICPHHKTKQSPSSSYCLKICIIFEDLHLQNQNHLQLHIQAVVLLEQTLALIKHHSEMRSVESVAHQDTTVAFFSFTNKENMKEKSEGCQKGWSFHALLPPAHSRFSNTQ